MVLKQLDMHMQRKDTHCTSFTKFNLKWIIDLNVKCQVIKLPEKNSGESSDDLGYVIDNLIWLKLKTSALWKTILKEWEDKAQIGRKYLQKTHDQGLLSKIDK